MTDDDFGRRLRAARRLAGLSQAEAADGIVSASYLSLIEAGRRRATPDVATALAKRMRISRTSDATLVTDPAFVAAQAALHAGRLEAAEAAIARVTPGSPTHLFLAGQLQERRGHLLDAVRSLDSAWSTATWGGELWFEIASLLCRFALDAGMLNRAIEVGEAAVAAPVPANARIEDLAIDVRATLSSVYCETGDLDRARALTEPVEASTARQRAAQLWARSIIEHTEGNDHAADQYVSEALHLFRTQDRPLSVARLQVTAATLRVANDRDALPAARALLVDAERALRVLGATVDLAACLCTEAQLTVLAGDTAAARASVEEAIMLVRDQGHGIRARIYAAAAGVFSDLGDAAAAHAHLLEARHLLEEVGARRAAAATWRALAAVHERMGDVDLALACMKAATELLGLPNPTPSLSPTQV